MAPAETWYLLIPQKNWGNLSPAAFLSAISVERVSNTKDTLSQGEFIFSYIDIESPEPRYQAGENSAETLFVDFENSKLYDASKEADFFQISFKYKSDIQITFLLE